MEAELAEFDKKNTKPLPSIVQRWRNRWVKTIKKNKICPLHEELQITIDSLKETIKYKDSQIDVLNGQLSSVRDVFKKNGKWTSLVINA
jgi:hypothetical protein